MDTAEGGEPADPGGTFDSLALTKASEAGKEATQKTKEYEETSWARAFKPNSSLARSPGKIAPVFGNAEKRRGSPLERARSCSLADLSAATEKRAKIGNDNMNRLLAEIKRLNDLIKPSKTKTEIRDSALKVRSLFDLVHFDWCQKQESCARPRTPIATNTELCDGSTQTPPSIQQQLDVDYIRKSMGDPSNHEEILKMHWPKEVFEKTQMVKGGLMQTRAGTAKAIICPEGKVGANDQLAQLAFSIPSLKKLTDVNLPAGKLAVVRRGDEIEIDGEKSSDGPQVIIVAAVECSAPSGVLSTP